MNLRFEPNFDDDVIDEDGDLVAGVEGESSYRVLAQCVSPGGRPRRRGAVVAGSVQ